MNELSHIDNNGKANMVDVSNKTNQKRTAVAEGFISLAPETLDIIKKNLVKKGDVISVAEIAGIMAAKRTPELIPLCHNLNLSKVDVKAEILDNGIKVTATVVCVGQTGVEMEALTAVSISLLTIYDMCKAVDKSMIINEIKLLNKQKEKL